MQSLIRREENPLQDLMDDFFPTQLFPSIFGKNFEGNLVPRVDVEETETGYSIKAELPGLLKEDVAVNIEDGVLTISGEKKKDVEKKGKNFYRSERSYGRFSRSFELPSNIDQKKIDAKYLNGVLEVLLTKTEDSKPKIVEIKIN